MTLRKFCPKTGCQIITTGGCCEVHSVSVQKADKDRGTAAKRGYGSQWRKARAGFLRKNQLCVQCKEQGLIVGATVVDHIKPHKGDKVLFWDRLNWQPLCKPHHDAKTAREDGGFANARRT